MSDLEQRARSPVDAAGAIDPGAGVADYLLAMSRELRAPLNAIIGMSGLVLESELPDRQRQYMKGVHAAGESLATILNDLLDLARAERGRLAFEPIAFDLQSMVEETVQVLGARAEERGLALRVEWRPELPRYVVGDPGRTRQVVGNLIGHAVNATSQGEVVVRVAPESERDGVPVVSFVVEDTGIGLPPARLERIFTEYVPVDASPYRSFGVSGLGLRISAELVRLMGGEIGARSEVGKGSRFWFRLPMPAAHLEAEPVAFDAGPRPGGRVLFVEPDQAARRRTAELLTAAGWHAEFADDLAQVEDVLETAHAAGTPFRACFLSDYAVRPSHAELAMRLKAIDSLRPVALGIITAVGSPGEGQRLWHAGFAAYLRKPVPPDELRDALTAIERLGPEGRGPSLITRHSIAEARNAHSGEQIEALDEVLAELTAPVSRQALVVGSRGAGQLELTEALAQCGYVASPVDDASQAADALANASCEIVLIDVDSAPPPSGLATFGRAGARRIPIAAITVDPVRRDELLRLGFDDVVIKPVRRADLDRVLQLSWPDEPAAGPVDESGIPAGFVAAAPAGSDTIDDRDWVMVEQPEGLLLAHEEVGEATPPLDGLTDAYGPDAIATDAVVDPVDLVPTISAEPEAVTDVLERATAEFDNLTAEPESVTSAEPRADLAGRALDEPDPAAPAATAIQPIIEPAEAEPFRFFGLGIPSSAGASRPASEGPDGIAVEPTAVGPSEGDRPASTPDEREGEEPAHPIGLLAPPAPATPDPATTDHPELPLGETVGSSATATPEPKGLGAEIGTLTLLEPPDESGEPPFVQVNGRATVIAEEPTPASTLPVVGEAVLEQLASGGGMFADHLVGTFLRDAPERIAELRTAAARADAEAAGRALRMLSAMSGLLGAARLGELCEAMEGALADDDMEAVARRVPELERSLAEARAELEAAIPARGDGGDAAPVGEAFLRQLAPDRDGAARALAQQLAGTFVAQAPGHLRELAAAIERQDAEAVQRLAPTLKGMCGLIGANPLAKLCAVVEADARLRRIGSARRYVEQLRLELDRVMEVLARAGR